jgi:predicted MFS family arabinose efflux permease
VEEMGSTSSAAQRRRRQWTLALVTAAALLELADEALLPAVYREVGEALAASPTALGSLTLCRALVQAVCYPLATCAAARYDRARVVAAGAFLWAVATLLVGASGTFLQVSDCRARCCFASLRHPHRTLTKETFQTVFPPLAFSDSYTCARAT